MQILVNLNSLQTPTVNLAVNKLRDLCRTRQRLYRYMFIYDTQVFKLLSSICRYLWNFYNYKREKHFSHQNTKTHSSPPCMKLVSQNRVPISQHWPHLGSKVHRRWSMPLYMYNQQLPYSCSSLQNNNPKCTNSKLVVSCKRFGSRHK